MNDINLTDDNLINELQVKSGITDMNNMSEEDVGKLVKSLYTKDIDENHLKALDQNKLVMVIDSFSVLSKGLEKLADKSSSISIEALEKINFVDKTITLLQELAKDIQSDSSKVKIAELIVTVSKDYVDAVKEINETDKSFLNKLVMGVGLFLGVKFLLQIDD